jgi:hypothetical protein
VIKGLSWGGVFSQPEPRYAVSTRLVSAR